MNVLLRVLAILAMAVVGCTMNLSSIVDIGERP